MESVHDRLKYLMKELERLGVVASEARHYEGSVKSYQNDLLDKSASEVEEANREAKRWKSLFLLAGSLLVVVTAALIVGAV